MHKRLQITEWLALFVCAPLQAQVSSHIESDSLHLGSIDIVTESRMNKGLVNNALNALSGQAAGVNVASNGADRMAMLSSVRVRGTTSLTGGNDPLVIIDGVNSDLSTLSTIYPADIESFTILKNAAETAQYGSRGASGVIDVKTKHGHGGQFHISYDGNIGFDAAYKRVKMLDAPGYVSLARELGVDYNDGGYSTDFQKEISRTGFVQNHHIAFSGGSDKSNYRASVGVMDHNTVIKINDYVNFVAKYDLTQMAFNDFLKVDLGAFGSTSSTHGIFDEQKLFYSAATQNPTFCYGPTQGDNWQKNSTASQINPPGALINERNNEKTQNFNTHLRFDFNLGQLFRPSFTAHNSLHLTLFGSYSYSNTENAQFCPTWVWGQGQAYRGNMKTDDWLANAMLTFSRKAGIHEFQMTLMGEYQKTKRDGFWTTVKGFTDNDVSYHNLSAGSIRPYGGTGSEYSDPALASVMASLNYTLLDRYAIALTLRDDGSNMVGRDNRWGLFPSVSLTWDILKDLRSANILTGKAGRWLTMLKLRTGYGLTGNLDAVTSYYTRNLMSAVGVVNYNGSPTVTMGMTRNYNPDLKWETRSTFNLGVDLGLMGNRIVMRAEYYTSRTHDMLYEYDVPTPPYPYNKLLANIGKMSNSGFELGMGITPIQKRDMELNINVNVAWQRTRLLSLSGDYNGTYMTASEYTAIGSLNGAGFHGGDNNIVYQIVGQPLGVFYLPHCTGLTRNADGSYSYAIADLDHNGAVNIEDGGDRYVAGQATPKVTLGSNISLRYKDFDISLQMNGAFGHKIYNGTALSYMNMSSFPDYNVMAEAPGRNIKDQTATDYWLEKGDYLNFDYLTVGWNVPLKSSKYVSALRLSCSVNNLATITSYSGITPMINSYVVNNTLGIDDKRSYPAYRTYSLSVSISF
jgi:TonB-linked SusC/RagA family outer membrane protein